MSYEEVMFKYSWINIQLMMTDKLHYIGKDNDQEMTKEEEFGFFLNSNIKRKKK